MKNLLVKVNDKARLSELEKFGEITYAPKYSSVICFCCIESRYNELLKHPIVVSVEDAPEVAFQN